MLLAGASGGALAGSGITLSFGVYSSDKPSSMVRQFRPVLNALEKRMSAIHGHPVTIRMHVSKSYEQGLNDLVSGRVDFARFGPASYIKANEWDPRIEILVLESRKGRKVFKGVICVADDSPIQNVAQLKGKTFAFGNERSTIGRYLAQLYLLRHDITASDLSHYEYLGRHDAVGAAVGGGRFDAGALKESTFKKLVADGVPLRAIADFPNVTKPWIARGGLPDAFKALLRKALLSLDDRKAMKALKTDGFIEGNDEDYAFIREAMVNSHLFFQQNPSIAKRGKKK
ncbi:MAG: PhnD/SsuA/transferrin family substrate-binding protein [Alphaproteobacteria bacterium]|nr:PhnD/SsuA/transferrin family substrate-binding protein [Alphaproteobacteria bacterium]